MLEKFFTGRNDEAVTTSLLIISKELSPASPKKCDHGPNAEGDLKIVSRWRLSYNYVPGRGTRSPFLKIDLNSASPCCSNKKKINCVNFKDLISSIQ